MRTGIAAVLIGLVSCAGPGNQVARMNPASPAPPENSRLANLRRAAQYPWVDEGACAAREAAGEWRVLIERCYGALDLLRIQFRDVEHRCAVAQADTATLQAAIGMCLLIQPELVVGALIVVGVVVIASAIAAEIAKEMARNGGCKCFCLGSGATDGKGNSANDGPLLPSKTIEGNKAINTPAQCVYACQRSGYASGFCK